MKIIRKYIIKQMVSPFLLFLSIFTFVLLLGNIIRLADLVINRGVEGWDILRLFLSYIPYLLSYTIPMSLLSATLLTFSRLSSDGEITAMRASGINLFRLSIPIIIIGLLFSMFNVIINDQMLPRSRYQARKIAANIGVRNPESFLEPGTFIKSFQDYIIFFHDIDGNKLHRVRIYQPTKEGPTRTIIAEKGEIIGIPESNSIKLKLINGTSDEPAPQRDSRFLKVRFRTYYVTLSLERDVQDVDKKPKDMTIKQLQREIRNFKRKNIDTIPLESEIHKKLILSFACLAFVLIGMPLGIVSKRSGKSIGLGISLVVIVFYYLMLVGTETLIMRGILPVYFLWASNIILSIAGILFIYKHMHIK